MVRLVNVIHVIFRSSPVGIHHFVEQEGLLAIAQDVPLHPPPPSIALLPDTLVAPSDCSNPSTPIQSVKSFEYSFDGLSFAVLQRKFRDGPCGIVGYVCHFRVVKEL